MAKYKVIRPWHGVLAGQVVEIPELHPALRANVFKIEEEGSSAELVVATPAAGAGRDIKKEVVARLRELGLQFDGRSSAADLIALLPSEEHAQFLSE